MYLRIIKLDAVDSTNNYLYQLALKGEREITVVVARKQTKGKGRLGRRWISPDGGMYASFLLRPKIPFPKLNLLGIIASLAGVKTLKKFIPAKIKWPNDIIVNDKKIGGVLLESKFNGSYPEFVIVGIGININTESGCLPDNATSLYEETKRTYSCDEIFSILLHNFIQLYKTFLHDKIKLVIQEIFHYLHTLNRRITIDTKDGTKIEGIALSLSKNGGLIIKDFQNIYREIFISEIYLLRIV